MSSGAPNPNPNPNPTLSLSLSLPYPYPYSDNFLNGGLESLRGCTALHILDAYGNQLTGGLEFLQDFTRLRELDVPKKVITLTLTPFLTLQ